MKKIIDLHNEIKKSLISIQVLEMRFNTILDEGFFTEDVIKNQYNKNNVI